MSQNTYPLIAYNNQVPAATIAASTEDTDYPKENVQDERVSPRWKGTGSGEQYLEADLGAGSLTDEFADLSNWTETDANGTLSAAGGALTYDSGANANDNPDITWAASISVNSLFALELVFDVTAFATATASEFYFEIELAAGYKVRAKVDDNTQPRVTFQRDAGAGSWTTVGTYTLSGGTSGRIKFLRESDGDVTCSVYDDNDSAYHEIATYAGGSNYTTTSPAAMTIEFCVDTRTAGAMQVSCATLYHSDASGVIAMGIAGHDMYDQGCENVRLDASVGGVGWETVVSAFTPSNNRAILKLLTDAAERYYRLIIPTGYTSPPGIGAFFLGDYLEFPTWCYGDFDPDRQNVVYEENRSMTGQLIGTSERYRDRDIVLTFDRLGLTWVQNNLIDDFWENARGKPVFLWWDRTNHASAIYYLLFAPKRLEAPMGPNHRSTTIELRGPVE